MVSGAAGLAPEERAATDGSQFDARPAYIVKLAYQNTLRGSIPSSPRSAREISSTTCSPAELHNSNQLHLQNHRRLPVRLSRSVIRKLRRGPRLFRVPLSPMNIAVVVLAYCREMLTRCVEMVFCCL
jgi:hypothetical protein